MTEPRRSATPERALDALLDEVATPGRLLLAYSGGLDSRVLLELLAAQRAARGLELQALHVHHGLSEHADQWAEACAAVCARLQVPFQTVRVQVPRDHPLGIEAAAREARYQALFAQDADYVVLAQHQDDQAETLLLQLLRGAGVKGLAAMAPIDHERRLLRPLLGVTRAALHRFATTRGLTWVEDESNLDQRFDRNFIRHEILPRLQARFRGASRTLARTAGHMAESAALLDALARIDAADDARAATLSIAPLQRLDPARARNLLRWWLAARQLPVPGAARLRELLRQVLQARDDALVQIALGGDHCLRRYRSRLYPVTTHPAVPIDLSWRGEPTLTLPDGSHLDFTRVSGRGLALARLGDDSLRVVNRRGGERFRPQAGRPTRSLKQLLQQAGMPPWLRQRLPLIYHREALAVVPGIGVAAQLQAQPDEAGLLIEWRPAP